MHNSKAGNTMKSKPWQWVNLYGEPSQTAICIWLHVNFYNCWARCKLTFALLGSQLDPNLTTFFTHAARETAWQTLAMQILWYKPSWELITWVRRHVQATPKSWLSLQQLQGTRDFSWVYPCIHKKSWTGSSEVTQRLAPMIAAVFAAYKLLNLKATKEASHAKFLEQYEERMHSWGIEQKTMYQLRGKEQDLWAIWSFKRLEGSSRPKIKTTQWCTPDL